MQRLYIIHIVIIDLLIGDVLYLHEVEVFGSLGFYETLVAALEEVFDLEFFGVDPFGNVLLHVRNFY